MRSAPHRAHTATGCGAVRRRAGEALLRDAAAIIAQRRQSYGPPSELFDDVAKRWSLALGIPVSPARVVLCLLDLKLARLAHDPGHRDSQLDLAGYATILRELTGDG